MMNYKFSPELSQAIVDGILKGYRHYIHEREQKKREMLISTGYAWVKGNHIEDAVAQECRKLGIQFEFSKAGYAWGYLKFENKATNSLFIIKSGGPSPQSSPSRKEEHYLVELSKINRHIDWQQLEQMNEVGEQLMLEEVTSQNFEQLSFGEFDSLKQTFDQFYIVSYEMDETKLLSKIQLLMPTPGMKKIHLVEDWLPLAFHSSYHITEIEVEGIRGE
ncbi:hypothetical protein P4U90_06420 [Cytobacillus kochii]|uniref:spr1630 family ClpXP-sensitive toxin n=1 Tax=Cytobacillus kochii TaxID=859143 RepID=UPI002E1DC97B|nr:hypothetical protein [Cytobacillus kochii]